MWAFQFTRAILKLSSKSRYSQLSSLCILLSTRYTQLTGPEVHREFKMSTDHRFRKLCNDCYYYILYYLPSIFNVFCFFWLPVITWLMFSWQKSTRTQRFHSWLEMLRAHHFICEAVITYLCWISPAILLLSHSSWKHLLKFFTIIKHGSRAKSILT